MDRLTSELRSLLDQIPIDFGGGCSFGKAYLMAGLIRDHRLTATVDIGVYRGRSLFPQALAHKLFTGGVVYGVDPYTAAEAREHDNAALKEAIDHFLNHTDLDAICHQVQLLRSRWDYEAHCVLLRQTSAEAFRHFEENDVLFDLIHIDGNHDTRLVMQDVEMYAARLRPNGFMILDDISWDSVKPAREWVAARMRLLYERVDKRNDYAVFWNAASRLGAFRLRRNLARLRARSGER